MPQEQASPSLTATTTFYSFSPTQSFASTSSPSPPAPAGIPHFVYRVHRTSAQARYSFSKGFNARNQSTVVNFTAALSRFGLAHLNQQTNISSPFISVYDNLAHAEDVAKHYAQKYGEDTFVITVDTKYLARGPIFRAADLLKDEKAEGEDEWLHWGEYLIMYRIPMQAIRAEMLLERGTKEKWRAVGFIEQNDEVS